LLISTIAYGREQESTDKKKSNEERKERKAWKEKERDNVDEMSFWKASKLGSE